MNQSTKVPTRKVTAAGAGGAAVVVLMAVLDMYGISLDPAVVAALVTLIAFGAGYLVTEK